MAALIEKKKTGLLWLAAAVGLCFALAMVLLLPRETEEPAVTAPPPTVPETVEPTAAPTAAPTEAVQFTGDPQAWYLLLVNPWNSLPEDFSVELIQLVNGHAIDQRVYPELQRMMDDMRSAGLSPLICSSYRTQEKQQTLFDYKVNTYLALGYSQAQAEAEAGTQIAVPGTSEHQTGMAVDIVDMSYQQLDEAQENTAVQQWLMANSWKYGFLLRYPNGKSDITGIIYEPWHYRYVGRDAARQIYENGLCLEEFLEALPKG